MHAGPPPAVRPRRRWRSREALDEDWISLNTGAAMLQKQQQAALAANRPLRLRMQVRSFDAVCHLVASGLGLAVLPKAAALPIIRAMGLGWRPLADPWAHRQLLAAAAVGAQGDPVVQDLIDVPGAGAFAERETSPPQLAMDAAGAAR